MNELSTGASFSWQVAASEASSLHHQSIEPEHLFIGVLSLGKVLMLSDAQVPPQAKEVVQTENQRIEEALHFFKLDPDLVRRLVRNRLGQGNYQHTEKQVHRSESCKKAFEKADALATPSGTVTSLHMLAAILESPGEIIGHVLSEHNVKPADLRQRALANAQAAGVGKQESTNYLDKYGRDLTRDARDGRLGPFVGRRHELLQIVQTLARQTKNNPVLVGEVGVGKTAIVEALALRVVAGKGPDVLNNKRIIELNVGTLVGGTKYRGEFEERLSRILAETRSHPEVILFIDEIHTVVGAGRAEGSMDAANLMKPALARGEIRCIGATTITEYRRYIESDAALERRFEKIIVNEPTTQETLEMLSGLKPKLEKHHGVQITDAALKAALELSVRFDGDHHLPDKAIDLVDKAGARKRVPMLSMNLGSKKDIGKAGSVLSGDADVVSETTIAEVLSEKTGLPFEIVAGQLDGMKQSKLAGLESQLNRVIIGQDDAIARVCQRLLVAHTGLAERRGSLAVFLFLGPTGVGKTELARSLSKSLFGDESHLIRLDMSEYMEQHGIAKLIGSPPGYVGHEEEGQLTGKLRTTPYAVVLLDEIEKAHPQVFDLFLQVFDEGRLTDSKGRTADAKNAIFIMTSNIPADKHMGFRHQNTLESQSSVLNEVKKRFRTEFLNRIDEQIVFRSLNEEDIRTILRSTLQELSERLLSQQKIVLQVEGEAEKYLARVGYSPEYGVRELRRSVETHLHVPIGSLIANGRLMPGGSILVGCRENKLVITPSGFETL